MEGPAYLGGSKNGGCGVPEIDPECQKLTQLEGGGCVLSP